VDAEQGQVKEQQRQRHLEWLDRFASVDRQSLGLQEQRELLAGLIERITVTYLPEANAHELRILLKIGLEKVVKIRCNWSGSRSRKPDNSVN